jgi:hypothetical protein
MSRTPSGLHRSTLNLTKTGLPAQTLDQAITFVYDTLDAIDEALLKRGSERLAEMVELANLSSMIGNLLRTGVAKASNGTYKANGPHKHPDLLHSTDSSLNVEIKVALEDNQPKGHLAKPGWHLTCHYVLCSPDGGFRCGVENRGCVPWIWLLRFGKLESSHFNLSNTEGDSGKTAVVNAEGMKRLEPVFFDPNLCALPITNRARKARAIFEAFGLPYEPRE